MTLSDLTLEDFHERYIRSQQSITTGDEVLGGAFPRPPDLLDGFLLQSTVNLVAAEPHAGKTLLCLHLAASLASGVPLFKAFSVPHPYRVLFIGQDSGSWDMAEQLRKLCRGHGITSLANLDLRLNQGINLFDRSFLKHLEEYHEHIGFDVLIFDTLRDIHPGDENDSAQMGAVMQLFKTMRNQFQSTIFFTHHIRKPQFDNPTSAIHSSRGSTTIGGSIDIQLNLSRKDDEITLTFPKARGLHKSQRQELTILKDETEDPPTVCLSLWNGVSEQDTRLLNMLPCSRADLIAAGFTDNLIRSMIRRELITSPTRGTYARADLSIGH